jgi:hypothetical protein
MKNLAHMSAVTCGNINIEHNAIGMPEEREKVGRKSIYGNDT